MLAGCAPAAEEQPAYDQPTQIAHDMIEALGGKERWEALPGLRWTFVVEVGGEERAVRRHAWHKHSGMHRVEGQNRDGVAFCFIHDIDTGEGMAWMGGEAIEGDSLQSLLKLAKSMWTNDTYWFLMPYKLLDPGVNLAYEGTEEVDGMMCDKLSVTFDPGVGETPGDHYWVYVGVDDDRVCRWDYLLEGREPPPTVATWEGWEEHDGLWFSTVHMRDGSAVYTRDVQTVEAFDPAVFTEL